MNPSDRLINQKITVQSTLYETIACTQGTSTNLEFLQHRYVFPIACASKLRERIEIMVYAPSFFGGVFWGQNKVPCYSIRRKQTDTQTTRNALQIQIRSEVFSSYFSPYSFNFISVSTLSCPQLKICRTDFLLRSMLL